MASGLFKPTYFVMSKNIAFVELAIILVCLNEIIEAKQDLSHFKLAHFRVSYSTEKKNIPSLLTLSYCKHSVQAAFEKQIYLDAHGFSNFAFLTTRDIYLFPLCIDVSFP